MAAAAPSQGTSAPPSGSAAGLRNRKPATKSVNSGRGMGGSSAGVLRFYTDDAPGLKVGPTTVLVGALLFVGFVVLLHVWGKFRG